MGDRGRQRRVLTDVGLRGGVDDGEAPALRGRAPLAVDEELPQRDHRWRGHRRGLLDGLAAAAAASAGAGGKGCPLLLLRWLRRAVAVLLLGRPAVFG